MPYVPYRELTDNARLSPGAHGTDAFSFFEVS